MFLVIIMKDYLVKAYAFDGTVRIYTAVTTDLVAHAQEIHDLWPTSAAALGRLLTVSVIMGAMYANDQELTVRVEGDGIDLRPIAGTRPRGKNDEEDSLLEKELLQMQELAKQFELFDVTLEGNKALAKDDTVNP